MLLIIHILNSWCYLRYKCTNLLIEKIFAVLFGKDKHTVPVVFPSTRLYHNGIVLVDFKNGFERDFIIVLSLIVNWRYYGWLKVMSNKHASALNNMETKTKTVFKPSEWVWNAFILTLLNLTTCSNPIWNHTQ